MSDLKGEIAKRMETLFAGGSVLGMSEAELLRRFATDRDEAAFEAIASRHGPMILAVWRRMLDDPHDVEDSFQAVFLVLVRKAARLRDPDRLGPWLHAVAAKVARRARSNAWKRRHRERSSQTIANSAPSGKADGWKRSEEAEAEAERRDLREVLDEELSRLPEKYRDPIILCHLEGLTHDQAAACLKWPVGTVRGRLSRGRELLRTRLVRRGLSCSPAVLASFLPARAATAPVPRLLLSSAFRSLSRVAVSAAAYSIAEGVLSTMFFSKIRVVLLGSLVVGTLSVGAAVFGRQRIRETKPDQDTAKAVLNDEQPQVRNDREKERIGEDRSSIDRLEKLGAEADTIKAEIEMLELETNAIKEVISLQYPLFVSSRVMGKTLPDHKPDNEEENKAPEEFDREQQRKQQEEHHALNQVFLQKRIKLGASRRRLEKIGAELSKESSD